MDDATVKPTASISTPTPFTQAASLLPEENITTEVATSRFEGLSATYQSYGWVADLLALGVGLVATYRQFTASKTEEGKNPAPSTPDKGQILHRILDEDGELKVVEATLWDAKQVLGFKDVECIEDLLTQYFNGEGANTLKSIFSNLELSKEAGQWVETNLEHPYVLLNVENEHAKKHPALKAAIIKALGETTMGKIVNQANDFEGAEKLNTLEELLKAEKEKLDEAPQTDTTEKLTNKPSKTESPSWKIALPLILALGFIALRRTLPSLMGRISR